MFKISIHILFFFIILFYFSHCHVDRSVTAPTDYRKVECKKDRYFIKDLCQDEEEYLDWASANKQYPKLSDLTQTALQRITASTLDVDRASAMFFTRSLSDKRNRNFMEYLVRKESDTSNIGYSNSDENLLLAMIPGMFYRDNPEIEADGHSLRKLAVSIGISSVVIPVDQTAPSDINAQIICDFLSLQDSRKRIIIASVSKGSADFKRAIQKCEKSNDLKNVIGWLNLGGINKGSRIIDAINDSTPYFLEARLYFFWKGYNWSGFQSLRFSENDGLNSDMKLPEHIKTINVVAVPLFRHVTARARPFYEYLIRFGPNDGFNLLGDSLLPGSITVPSWRNDHYFQRAVSTKQIRAVLEYLAADDKNKEKLIRNESP